MRLRRRVATASGSVYTGSRGLCAEVRRGLRDRRWGERNWAWERHGNLVGQWRSLGEGLPGVGPGNHRMSLENGAKGADPGRYLRTGWAVEARTCTLHAKRARQIRFID